MTMNILHSQMSIINPDGCRDVGVSCLPGQAGI